jgi:hypothetical protein
MIVTILVTVHISYQTDITMNPDLQYMKACHSDLNVKSKSYYEGKFYLQTYFFICSRSTDILISFSR